MSESNFLPQMALFEMSISPWQMALFVTIVSLCVLLERYKVALLTSYLFSLYWVFFLYWGEAIARSGLVPNTAMLFIMCGLVHVTLTLIAFLKEEQKGFCLTEEA